MANAKKGLDQADLEQETATVLPEREAMSLIDPSVTKVALSNFADPTDPIDPPMTTGQGINEKVAPE